MVGLVSGFPGSVAALKFEWALTNPHLSLHIPSGSRITIATQKKRNGHAKRPRHSVISILSNLHLLLRVPSFNRWPLSLHFFAPDVYNAWNKWCSTVSEPLRKSLEVFPDFEPAKAPANSSEPSISESRSSKVTAEPWGIHALPLDYAPLKEYVTKADWIFKSEQEGDCIICKKDLPPDTGLYAVCYNEGCEGVGHVTCWSQHLLGKERDEHIMPVSGHCPKCHGDLVWGDMMKEMTLRLRGQKDVAKLLKKPRKRKAARASADED